jgi:hypothetical protein
MEAINLSLSRHRIADRKEFNLLRRNMKNVMHALDNFVPNVVEALTEVIKKGSDS